ncbi:hypothetical protein D3C75_941900 [compost metagenome]
MLRYFVAGPDFGDCYLTLLLSRTLEVVTLLFVAGPDFGDCYVTLLLGRTLAIVALLGCWAGLWRLLRCLVAGLEFGDCCVE